MPVVEPTTPGLLGRSRTRISSSSLTTFLRCKNQWFWKYKIGLTSPKSISQILGIELEDALCRVLMNTPVSINSLKTLTDWAISLCSEEAKVCLENSEKRWNQTLWKNPSQRFDSVNLDDLEKKIVSGIELFLDEVKLCYQSNGGPFIDRFRTGDVVFETPAPCWRQEPKFTIPDKVRNFGLRNWSRPSDFKWEKAGSDITWSEAWEIARPWFKDPRVHQPQRIFHPDGWAAGELDLVLRWDGNIRIIDIKSGTSNSKFAKSLEHQLTFYSWLWYESFNQQVPKSLHGWYLGSKEVIDYETPSSSQFAELASQYHSNYEEMNNFHEGSVLFPLQLKSSCTNESGCFWCRFDGNNISELTEDKQLSERLNNFAHEVRPPYEMIQDIPNRVNVKGKFTGKWGPLPNHYSEPVLGAMLTASGTQVTIEESEPGAFPDLHDLTGGEVIIKNALPGVWRGNPRLYVDSNTEIVIDEDSNRLKLTRIGLLRVKSNVSGIVISIDQRKGMRYDEKPWTMLNFHIWDGHSVVEVVAFGSSITTQLINLNPGDEVKITSAELGWRSGLPQLRIDSRSTRVIVN